MQIFREEKSCREYVYVYTLYTFSSMYLSSMSSHPLTFPLYESVPAGLPFTPETGEHTPLDITNYLIEHPASTYLVRVRGESMQERGILSGDIVVVDRARIARSGDIVIASFSGAVTLKILEKET